MDNLIISEHSNKYPTFKYEIPFSYTIIQNLPIRYRKPKFFAYLYSCIYPLIDSWFDFLLFRKEIQKRLKVKGATCIIQQFLNDKLDTNEITIVNTPVSGLPTYLYNKSEKGDITNENTYLFNISESITEENKTYLYNKSEILNATNFTVYVPSILLLNGVTLDYIKSLIDPFVAITIKYTIVVV